MWIPREELRGRRSEPLHLLAAMRPRGFTPEVIYLPGAAVTEKVRLVPKDGAPGVPTGGVRPQPGPHQEIGGWEGCSHFIGEATMAQRG